MSIKLMTDVWADDTIDSKAELLLLLALADFAHDDGTAWPSTATLAHKTRCTDRNVQKMMGRLIRKGWVSIELNGGPRGVNLYRLNPRHQEPPVKTSGGHQRHQSPSPATPEPPSPATDEPLLEPSKNHQLLAVVSESDSPKAPEAPPQDQAEAPPPAGPRRAPRMPPPRQNALGSFEASREAGTDEGADHGAKAPATRQGQRMPAATVDPQEVMEAWNEVAEKLGLPRCVALNPKRKARIATLAKDKFWRDNWAAAVDWIPNVDWIVEKRCKCDFEWFLKYDSVIRLAEGRTATPSPTSTPAPPPKPKSKHPVGSPEWEREILRGS